MESLLIIDDEKSIIELLSVVFKNEGYSVTTALSAAKAFKLIEEHDFDLIISDIKLPEKSGMDVLKFASEKKPEVPVLMITAYGTVKQAVEAFKMGAVDYVMKPFDIAELKIVVAKGLEKKRLKEENKRLRKELKEKYSLQNMIGKSKPIREIYSLVEKIAGTDVTVLISGESGTGKEVAARAIHYHSQRREEPFISINCGALPENLLESELYGHVKGSFTGAVADKKGMFEVAGNGTLFLDEIGEMTSQSQVKLLKSLEDRKIRRVGGTTEIPVGARIITATNQNLTDLINKGQFREDLYYRLNVIAFEMPALRHRKEDIPPLVSNFLIQFCNKMGKKQKRMTPGVMNTLEAYHWPGNVRELENLIERVVAIEDRETITEECLPQSLFSSPRPPEMSYSIKPGFDLNEALEAITCNFVKEALALSGGNLRDSASFLGINYRSLRYLIDKFDLKNSKPLLRES